MANIKINQLPAGTTPLDGTELIPVDQGATTVKVTSADIAALAGVGLPTPIVTIPNAIQNTLQVQFNDISFLQTAVNPELFLFRWKPKRRAAYNTPSGRVVRKKGAGYVHPTNLNCETKWAGWKWFNGIQFWNYQGGNIVEVGANRQTEWSIPSTLMASEKLNVQFNRFMFRQEINNTNTLNQFDNNMFATLQYALNDPQNQSDPTKYVSLGGNARYNFSNNTKYGKIQKFCLALAVDNPSATKTNGLCPKIFSDLSIPFYTALYNQNFNIGGIPNTVAIFREESAPRIKLRS